MVKTIFNSALVLALVATSWVLAGFYKTKSEKVELVNFLQAQQAHADAPSGGATSGGGGTATASGSSCGSGGCAGGGSATGCGSAGATGGTTGCTGE